jgi:hypothetical protein
VLMPDCIGVVHTPQSATDPAQLLHSAKQCDNALEKPRPAAEKDSLGSWGIVQRAFVHVQIGVATNPLG